MVQQTIDRANAQFMDAFKRGDMDAVSDVYTRDAQLLPPDSAIVRGRTAIKEFWTGARQMGIREASLETLDFHQAGDTGYEIGLYTLRIQPDGGDESQAEGKYVVVWRRDADGAWKWAVDIWNAGP